MIKYIFCILLIVGITGLNAWSQTQSAGISDILTSIKTFNNRLPAEKLYLHFDKPYYSIGDTMWFKAYLFDATFLTEPQKSGLVYLELANDTNKVLLRRMLPVPSGLGRGNIVLNKDIIPEGTYTIRAYTNLMRNFGEDRIFKKTFYVSSLASQTWLVSTNSIIADSSGKTNLRMGLKLSMLDGRAVGLKDLQLRVMEGRRVLLRDKVQTDVTGSLDISFNLPEKASNSRNLAESSQNPADARPADNISIIAEDDEKGKQQKITIPIPVNRPENIDLQFMPEGGNMANGIPARIGFKAISADGKGVEVAGKVYSSSGSDKESLRDSEEVAEFHSTHKGMGSFYILPKATESYTAKITLPDGTTKNYPLPQVKSTGTTLTIRNARERDSLEIVITIPATQTSATATATFSPDYYLIGQYGSAVCYALSIRSSIRMKIEKKLFATGITHFTLLNDTRQPVNERLVYIDRHNNLDISITPDKATYKTRDSIALNIEAKDREDKPVVGSFSITVTDDGQVKTDSTQSNIRSNILLTSDLKGTVEDPNWYFNNPGNESWFALDNLLLTQGWVGYDPIAIGSHSQNPAENAARWQKVFNPLLEPEHAADEEFMVKGKVTNVFNKSVERSKVMLLSTRPPVFMDTITDENGRFTFRGFPRLDSVTFKLQATNQKDKSFNVDIEVEEFKPPIFKPDLYQSNPWYLNTDTTLLNYVKTTITQKQEEMKLTGKNVLDIVTITANKIVKGSWNLNGPGNSDFTLDENEVIKAGKMSLLKLLEQKVPGFALRTRIIYGPDGPLGTANYYSIQSFNLRIIIDGMDLNQYYTPLPPPPPAFAKYYPLDEAIHYYEYIKGYLDNYVAEDIRGIEVMHKGKYGSAYNSQYNDPFQLKQVSTPTLNGRTGIGNLLKGNEDSWIEVTTRSGAGALLVNTPGTYLHKTIPFAGSKQFYSPKYTVKDKPALLPDLRSTIHWEPDVITDENGKAVISFYSADKPGSYTIITEGSDMNGNVGTKKDNIIIKP